MPRSEWWNSDAHVGRDGFCRSVFAEAAFPMELYGCYDDFNPGKITSATTYLGWTVTVLTAGTLVMADEIAGVLQLTGGADGQGIQMQTDGEAYLPAANCDIWCEAKVRLTDADDADWMWGLASTDADVFTGDPTELIVFRGADGSPNINFQVRDGGAGAAVDTGSDLANTTWARLGFWVQSNTAVVPYINGTALTAVTANIPTAEMSLTLGMWNGATAANQPFSVDWLRAVQLRA